MDGWGRGRRLRTAGIVALALLSSGATFPHAVDPHQVDPHAVDPQPIDPQAVDPQPIDPQPIDPQPIDPQPIDPQPIDPMVLPVVNTLNVEYVANVPEAANATAINFIDYGDRDVMFVSGRFGLLSYDITDPAAPAALGSVGNAVLSLPGESGTFWQNEDMAVDPERRLVFLSRDPRAYGGNQNTGASGVYIIDASDPADLDLIVFHPIPAGHTSTCVNDCQYLWTGGPARASSQPSEWGGRPIFVTDITDPANPVTFPDPVDTGRNDGRTDYSHDVQVDASGVAWVSGRGGVRGYWTEGEHVDPLTGEVREATAWDPIAYAGGGIASSAAPSNFMHNSWRPVGDTVGAGASPDSGYDPEALIYVTEEAFTPQCQNGGNFVIASLEGSFDGEGWRSTPDDPFRLETVGVWSPWLKEGMGAGASCSAHYFQLQDGVAAYSWYTQGTRFIDVTDPSDPIQIAYFRPTNANAWAPYFHGDHVYVADSTRGVDVVRLSPLADEARANRTEVLAPPLSHEAARIQAATLSRYAPDPVAGWSCRLPRED